MKPINNITSLATSIKPMYLTSVVERATTCWRETFQLTVFPNRVKAYPISDLFLSLSSAKSM